jgi:hypothetical protein
MSILTKAKKIYRVVLNPQIFTCRVKYLFVFSHMRSRSSVLSHVLGTNSNICGYRELHTTYRGRMSLIKMRAMIFSDLECNLNDKYLLDKILHDYHFSDRVFEIVKPKVIFLLREPEDTIKSIINIGYNDPMKVMDYYCDRLMSLIEYSKKIGKGYFFIESNELVDNTDNVLESLSIWLNLSEPLDKRYLTFRNTGKPGHGDTSHNIKSGILKKTKNYSDLKIPREVLQRGESSYKNCRDSLLKGIIK